MTELDKTSAKADIQAQFDEAGGDGGPTGDPTGKGGLYALTDKIFTDAAEIGKGKGAEQVAEELAHILRDHIIAGDIEFAIELFMPAILKFAMDRQGGVRRRHQDLANRGVQGFGGPTTFDTPTGREDVRLPGILDKYCLGDTWDYEGRTHIIGKMTIKDWGRIAARSEKQAAGNMATAARCHEAIRMISVAGVNCLNEVNF